MGAWIPEVGLNHVQTKAQVDGSASTETSVMIECVWENRSDVAARTGNERRTLS